MFRKYVFSTDHKVIGLQWEIVCSQLCGLGHYRMRGFYTIQTQADYDAWLAQETSALAAP